MIMEKSKKRKRTELDLKSKVDLINQFDKSGKSHRKLAEEFGIGKTQVGSILQNKTDILEQWENNANGSRKRLCVRTPLEELNSLMWEWFQKARSQSIPVSGPMLQQKALSYAVDLGITDFKASNGWLSRFRIRHNINFASICGESASVSTKDVQDWCEKLPDILKGYSSRDIYNMDETGLYYRALPDKSLNIRGEECKGGKKSKERLTVSLCVNMDGEFEKPLVIGKSAVPRCFRNIKTKNLPVVWKFNKKAWMNGQLFTEWVKGFNERMKKAHRHVVLLLDNAPAHLQELNLSNVKLQFLPANTTSKLQPLDQGIIQNLKQLYRKRLLTSVIAKIDESDTVSVDSVSKRVTVLDAVKWINLSLMEISPETVRKCFVKAGVKGGYEEDTEEFEEDDTPLADLISLMALARQKINFQGEMSIKDFVSVDSDVPTCDDLDENWEENLLLKHSESVESSVDVESDAEPTEETPCLIKSHQEALKYLEQLKLYCMSKDFTDILSTFERAEDELEKLTVASKCSAKQSSMLQFLNKGQ